MPGPCNYFTGMVRTTKHFRKVPTQTNVLTKVLFSFPKCKKQYNTYWYRIFFSHYIHQCRFEKHSIHRRRKHDTEFKHKTTIHLLHHNYTNQVESNQIKSNHASSDSFFRNTSGQVCSCEPTNVGIGIAVVGISVRFEKHLFLFPYHRTQDVQSTTASTAAKEQEHTGPTTTATC